MNNAPFFFVEGDDEARTSTTFTGKGARSRWLKFLKAWGGK